MSLHSGTDLQLTIGEALGTDYFGLREPFTPQQEDYPGLAKMHNTSKARQVLSDARDLLGGNGILLDHHVIRHLVDLESIHTFEGTETVQTLLVGRDITGVAAFA